MNFDIGKFVNNCHCVCTHQINDVVVIKDVNDWTKKKREKFQCSLKVKTIISSAFGINAFLCVSHCEIAKEIRDTLQVTHEETIEVKMMRKNILTHEYELLRMKLEENIYDMQKPFFIHIFINMGALEFFFKMKTWL